MLTSIRLNLKSAPRSEMHSGPLRFVLAVILLISACTGNPASIRDSSATDNLQWPPLPEPARIVWVRAIADYRDVGISDGFWRKVVFFFAGEKRQGFVRPHGLFMDANERLFVADPGAGVVHEFDVRNDHYRIIGRDDGERMITPIGITGDDRGRLYISDSTAGTVYLYDPNEGRLKPFLEAPLKRPTGIVWNRHDRLLYIVDTLDAAIIAVDDKGSEKKRISGRAQGANGFNHPTDIWIGPDGRIYVNDPLNFRIKIFSPQGELVGQIGAAGDTFATLNKPKGLATDSQGHIYICDSLQDVVKIFNDAGQLLLVFGGGGIGRGEFWMPSGIYIDERDYIFVSDTYNRRIQVYRYLPGDETIGKDALPQSGSRP